MAAQLEIWQAGFQQFFDMCFQYRFLALFCIEQRSSDFILDEQNVDGLFVQVDIVFIKNGVLENR